MIRAIIDHITSIIRSLIRFAKSKLIIERAHLNRANHSTSGRITLVRVAMGEIHPCEIHMIIGGKRCSITKDSTNKFTFNGDVKLNNDEFSTICAIVKFSISGQIEYPIPECFIRFIMPVGCVYKSYDDWSKQDRESLDDYYKLHKSDIIYVELQ